MNSYEDRRQSKRAPAAFAVEVNVAGQEYVAAAVDISATGVGFEVNRNIPAGAPVRLNFALVKKFAGSYRETRHLFDLTGKALYCEPVPSGGYHGGILFDAITNDDRSHIQQYTQDATPKTFYL